MQIIAAIVERHAARLRDDIEIALVIFAKVQDGDGLAGKVDGGGFDFGLGKGTLEQVEIVKCAAADANRDGIDAGFFYAEPCANIGLIDEHVVQVNLGNFAFDRDQHLIRAAIVEGFARGDGVGTDCDNQLPSAI